ncbi:hypothetical protein GpartN1_g845.t1 [Galdieria partita]|uniref:HTH La-type RNA-binding domain-containing protein n=1 Tax=Galdieria partita TaxID=83374 RepID=A0A9C7UMW1_9RHOD|nr:hypothetical protein GpartN1_g845.t1 [Galdieria partita]
MRGGNVQSVATENVQGREWNSENLKDETVGQKSLNVVESDSQITEKSNKFSTDGETTNSLNKDSPEPFEGAYYPYSRVLSSSFSSLSTPYMAPPSPFIAAPYYYPLFPTSGVISPGVPLSSYPFTLEMAIVHQIEYYLGQENLAKDVYLRQLMDPEMWVEIEKLVTFPKLSRLTTSVRLVARVLREFSFRIQVHDDDEKVRPMPPDSNDDKCLVIVKNISGNVSKEDFVSYLQQEMGKNTELKILTNMEDTWFVYCVDENDAERICSLLTSLSFHGNTLEARRKMEDSVRYSGELVMDFPRSNRHSTSPWMTPNSYASQLLPLQASTFSFPSFGTSSYVPMNSGIYTYPVATYTSYPINTGVTDTSRNARARRRGSNRSLKGNPERESNRVGDNEMFAENKAITEESIVQMSSTRFPARNRHQEKNFKNKTSVEGQFITMNGNVSSGNDNQQVTNYQSRSRRSISEKYSNNSKGKSSNEPNLSLSEFPPLPSTDGQKLNSLFRSGKALVDTTIGNGNSQASGSESETLDANETKVFLERDSNVCYEDTEKGSVPVLSFGDLVLSTENISDSQTL